MAWYRAGTVSVTNNSSAVLGAGTAWVTAAAIGETFLGPDGQSYEIVAINSATSLTIAPVYKGSTASGQSYAIMPTQGYLRDLAAAAAALVESYSSVKNNAGTGKFAAGTSANPSLRNAADENTGLNLKGNDQLALVTAGVERLALSASGVPSGTAVTHMLDRANHSGDLPASAVPDNLLTPQKTQYLGRHAYGGLTTGSLWLSGGAADPRASETVGADVTSVLLADSGTVLARRNAATTWRFSSDGSLALFGAGLELAGTALSTNARTLDFYEEGTFVPTIYGVTTAGAPTYASNVGNYTRIGDTVFWSAFVSISAIGGMVGALRIGGMPFAISASSANVGAASIGFYANLSGTSTTEILANHANGASNLRLYKRDSSSTGCTDLLAADIGATFRIYLSGNYKVA